MQSQRSAADAPAHISPPSAGSTDPQKSSIPGALPSPPSASPVAHSPPSAVVPPSPPAAPDSHSYASGRGAVAQPERLLSELSNMPIPELTVTDTQELTATLPHGAEASGGAAPAAAAPGSEGVPPQAGGQRPVLPGMARDLSHVDPTRTVTAWDVLQTLNLSSEELIKAVENKVTTEELLEFLSMGERRVVDLAIKVRALEQMNDDLQAQKAETSEQLKHAGKELKETLERLEQTRALLAAQEDKYQVEHSERIARAERNSEERMRREAEVKRAEEDLDQARRELEYLMEQRTARERDQKLDLSSEQNRAREYEAKYQAELQTLSKTNEELKKAQHELEEKHQECQNQEHDIKGKERTYKEEEVRDKKEHSTNVEAQSEEQRKLAAKRQALKEERDKLAKKEEALNKEKEAIRAALGEAVREIQEQREREHLQLQNQKEEFERELKVSFENRQSELDELWDARHQQEVTDMEERRKTFEQELTKMEKKAQGDRSRLEKYSQNLERYGRRLKQEYENMNADKQAVRESIDRSARELQETEDALLLQIERKEHELQVIDVALQSKDQQTERLREELLVTKQDRENLAKAQREWQAQNKELEKKIQDLNGENARLVEDNTLLEKQFNELKCEHDQLLEEMTYMRSREEEERELRRKTNEMLLASYRFKHSGSSELVTASGRQGIGEEDGAIDLLCWKCHRRQVDEGETGLLGRTREARRQMRALAVERRQLQSERDMFLKAHKLDSEKLGREAEDLRRQRELLRNETEALIVERKTRLDQQAQRPRTRGAARPREADDGPDSAELLSSLAAADPDSNPVDPSVRPTAATEGPEASRRRKRDLVYLRSIYASGGVGSPGRRSRSGPRQRPAAAAAGPAASPPQ